MLIGVTVLLWKAKNVTSWHLPFWGRAFAEKWQLMVDGKAHNTVCYYTSTLRHVHPRSSPSYLRRIHSSPEHTLSPHSTSLRTVVKFSKPSDVISTTSSMRTPPTGS